MNVDSESITKKKKEGMLKRETLIHKLTEAIICLSNSDNSKNSKRKVRR